MLQEIPLRLFGVQFHIYGYGLMLVAAFLACVTMGKWLARHSKIDPELMINAALVALIAGIAGARLSHVLENLGAYTRSDLTVWQNLQNVINIRGGGLTFYGGFLLATPCCIAYAWKVGIPIRLGMDIVAPVLMVGLGLGRIGCFLNGCCYGEQCSWGLQFPYYSSAYVDQFNQGMLTHVPVELIRQDAQGRAVLLPPESAEFRGSAEIQRAAGAQRSLAVQPTQLYSAFTAFLLAALLVAYFTLPHVAGRVFAMMLVLEGISRFILEMIRVEPAVWPHAGSLSSGLSLSMILGIANVIAGIAMWLIVGRLVPAAQSQQQVVSGGRGNQGKKN